ncbi:hypothetical protein FNV43_RR08028 [Rhamnella rubrinervis]|uniref:Uncharacterized protein n=1 Tax=Rhamnella rubrinervis TaxID=2594499 RepID=A0A8K0HG07_9ROSA|nr:hypothetical protein FNV43_RR08028 [Rhamnella rubrinervis]
MGSLMVEVCESPTPVKAAEEAVIAPPPPPPPPTHHRRPRVREVSSRFMSPMASSSSSSGDLPHLFPAKSPISKQHTVSVQTPNLLENQSRQRPASSQRRRRHLDMEPLCSSDENRPTGTDPPPQIPSSDTQLPNLEQIHATLALRKQRSAKLLKENGGGRQTHQQHPLKTCPGRGGNSLASPSRPDTPMLTASMDRSMPYSSSSRFRLMQQRSNNITSSAAAKLLQSSVMSLPAQPTNLNAKVSSQEASTSVSLDDPSLSVRPLDNHHDQIPDLVRSSMSEADMLPTVSSRYRTEKTCNRGGNGSATSSSDSLKLSAFPCSRSLNFPSSSSENSVKIGAICLPPVPPCASAKPGTDTRKAKKVSSHQEDVHSLRLLHNRYIQWRYANSRAEASLQAQQRETERKLSSLGVKISELYDSVAKKRIELGILQRTKTLSSILEAQIPYLEEWSAVEDDYSTSLAEAVQALSNASLRFPIGGNVKADIREVKESLNSAMKLMEIIASHVQNFIPKGVEMESLISELARVVGGERALVEECGVLLSNTYTSQVEECSLRGQIIQFHHSSNQEIRA